jgi:hypothetical protein
MSVIIQGYQLREIALGIQIIKAGQALPQTATANLFTVTGGAVLVTSLLGVVTTVIQGTDPVLSLGTAPASGGGTAETSGIATTTSIASAEVGTWLTVQSSSGAAGALINGGHGGSAVWLSAPFIVPAGTITWTTTASKTGAIKWYLTYVALDTGAAVS